VLDERLPNQLTANLGGQIPSQWSIPDLAFSFLALSFTPPSTATNDQQSFRIQHVNHSYACEIKCQRPVNSSDGLGDDKVSIPTIAVPCSSNFLCNSCWRCRSASLSRIRDNVVRLTVLTAMTVSQDNLVKFASGRTTCTSRRKTGSSGLKQGRLAHSQSLLPVNGSILGSNRSSHSIANVRLKSSMLSCARQCSNAMGGH
jgi:hypothetical protein